MSSAADRYKDHQRADYRHSKVTCRICIEIGKRKSKSFRNIFALKIHLATHTREDEIQSGITRKEILKIARCITTALEWNMFVDLPKVQS